MSSKQKTSQADNYQSNSNSTFDNNAYVNTDLEKVNHYLPLDQSLPFRRPAAMEQHLVNNSSLAANTQNDTSSNNFSLGIPTTTAEEKQQMNNGTDDSNGKMMMMNNKKNNNNTTGNGKNNKKKKVGFSTPTSMMEGGTPRSSSNAKNSNNNSRVSSFFSSLTNLFLFSPPVADAVVDSRPDDDLYFLKYGVSLNGDGENENDGLNTERDTLTPTSSSSSPLLHQLSSTSSSGRANNNPSNNNPGRRGIIKTSSINGNTTNTGYNSSSKNKNKKTVRIYGTSSTVSIPPSYSSSSINGDRSRIGHQYGVDDFDGAEDHHYDHYFNDGSSARYAASGRDDHGHGHGGQRTRTAAPLLVLCTVIFGVTSGLMLHLRNNELHIAFNREVMMMDTLKKEFGGSHSHHHQNLSSSQQQQVLLLETTAAAKLSFSVMAISMLSFFVFTLFAAVMALCVRKMIRQCGGPGHHHIEREEEEDIVVDVEADEDAQRQRGPCRRYWYLIVAIIVIDTLSDVLRQVGRQYPFVDSAETSLPSSNTSSSMRMSMSMPVLPFPGLSTGGLLPVVGVGHKTTTTGYIPSWLPELYAQIAIPVVVLLGCCVFSSRRRRNNRNQRNDELDSDGEDDPSRNQSCCRRGSRGCLSNPFGALIILVGVLLVAGYNVGENFQDVLHHVLPRLNPYGALYGGSWILLAVGFIMKEYLFKAGADVLFTTVLITLGHIVLTGAAVTPLFSLVGPQWGVPLTTAGVGVSLKEIPRVLLDGGSCLLGLEDESQSHYCRGGYFMPLVTGCGAMCGAIAVWCQYFIAKRVSSTLAILVGMAVIPLARTAVNVYAIAAHQTDSLSHLDAIASGVVLFGLLVYQLPC